MSWPTVLKVLLLGLVPPSIWRLFRGARLGNNATVDRRAIDRDVFLWEACMAAGMLSFIFFVLMAYGLLPFLSNGFVLAADVDTKVKATIESRVAQIEKKLEQGAKENSETARVAKNVEALLLDNLTEGTQSKIRAQVSRRCKAVGAEEREEINKEKEKLQKQHVQYTGQRYNEPRCDEL